MGAIMVALISFILLVLLQTFFSFRKNAFLGYLIPLVNIAGATGVAMQFSDYFVGYFVLFLCLLPLLSWFGIYYIVRTQMEKKIKQDMNRMKIQDI